MQEECSSFYLNHYIDTFCQADVHAVFATIPQLMQWDGELPGSVVCLHFISLGLSTMYNNYQPEVSRLPCPAVHRPRHLRRVGLVRP